MTKYNVLLYCTKMLCVLWLLNSCTQVDKTLGDNLLPPSQVQPIRIDTLSQWVTLEAVFLDSVPTNYFSTVALGRINDSRLGKTRAGFAAQFVPLSYNYSFPVSHDSIYFDSVVFILKFTGNFGTSDESMEIVVYGLDSALNDSVLYYGASKMGANIISNYSGVAVNTPISVNAGDTIVRICLNNQVTDQLDSTLDITNSADFVKAFKGLYVTVQDGSGGVIKYSSPVLTSYSTEITSALWAYYHYEKDSVTKGVFPYVITSAQQRFGVFEHEELSASSSGNLLYLRGLCGTAIKVKINGDSIFKWKKEKTINRVELTLDLDDAEKANPLLLNLFPEQLSGWQFRDHSYTYIRDMGVTSVFDGKINRSQMRYSFNITHTFNDFGSNKIDSFYIVPPVATMSYGVLKNKPILKVTYGERNN